MNAINHIPTEFISIFWEQRSQLFDYHATSMVGLVRSRSALRYHDQIRQAETNVLWHQGRDQAQE
jgi:hypothetical protein